MVPGLGAGAGEGESGNDEEEETKGSAREEDGGDKHGAGGGERIKDDGGKGDDLAQPEESAFKIPEATTAAAEAGEGHAGNTTVDLVAEED